MSNGGEESTGAEAGRGEEARGGDQLPEENKPTAESTIRGNYFAEKIGSHDFCAVVVVVVVIQKLGCL